MTSEYLVCELCAKAYPKAGQCPVHLDEPLLDARNEEVIDYLGKLDEKRLRKTILILTVGLSAVFGLIYFAIAWTVGEYFGQKFLVGDPGRLNGFATYLGVGLIIPFSAALVLLKKKAIQNHTGIFWFWTKADRYRPSDEAHQLVAKFYGDETRPFPKLQSSEYGCPPPTGG